MTRDSFLVLSSVYSLAPLYICLYSVALPVDPLAPHFCGRALEGRTVDCSRVGGCVHAVLVRDGNGTGVPVRVAVVAVLAGAAGIWSLGLAANDG